MLDLKYYWHLIMSFPLCLASVILVYVSEEDVVLWFAFGSSCLYAIVSIISIIIETNLVWYRKREHYLFSFIIFGLLTINLIFSVGLIHTSIQRRDSSSYNDRGDMKIMGPYYLAIDTLTGIGIGQILPVGILSGGIVAISEIISWLLTGLLQSILFKIIATNVQKIPLFKKFVNNKN